MVRYLVRPVYWRGENGTLQRVTLLVDRWDLLHSVVFAHRPIGTGNRLGQYLLDRGIDPVDVEVAHAELTTREKGEALLASAR